MELCNDNSHSLFCLWIIQDSPMVSKLVFYCITRHWLITLHWIMTSCQISSSTHWWCFFRLSLWCCLWWIFKQEESGHKCKGSHYMWSYLRCKVLLVWIGDVGVFQIGAKHWRLPFVNRNSLITPEPKIRNTHSLGSFPSLRHLITVMPDLSGKMGEWFPQASSSSGSRRAWSQLLVCMKGLVLYCWHQCETPSYTDVRIEIQARWWSLYVLKLCWHSNPNGILSLCWHFLISFYTLRYRPTARFILILYFFSRKAVRRMKE